VDVGDCNITASANYTCNPSAANLIAPAGFQFYNWWNSNYTTILATGQNATISPIPVNNTALHVEVIPYNGFGCQDTLHVLISNNNAVSNAGPDKFICSSASTIIGTPSIAGNTYSWSPTLGLSNPNSATPTATPLSTTTYYLTVNNPNSNCPAIDSVVVTVYPKPTPIFTTSASQCISNNNFSFVNNSTGGATYLWYFGDGTTSTIQSPTHSYATANTFTVKLVVTSANGCKDSVSSVINVYAKPIATFITPASQCFSNNNFSFVNNSTGAASYLWYFGDGTISTVQNPTHSYATANTYTVKLIVTNINGCKDSISRSIIVFPKPTAAFTTPASQCFSNNNFSFVNNSTGGATYLWYFGDGTTSTIQSPTHSYATANTFTVKLVITSTNGCKDSVSRIITVFIKPTAAFTTPASQCFSNNNFSFVNNSTGGASYIWHFGDGTTSTLQNPTHSYATPNTFTVKLIVTNINGCKDSISRSITVFPKPTAAFTTATPQCLSNNNFTFTNTTTGGATYLWFFGDGTTSTNINPTHNYATANTFTVKLIATSINGCRDSMIKVINVYANPAVSFITPASQCFSNNSFSFVNNSIGTGTYLWHFGDGTTSTLQNPTHSYATANAFTVKLVVTNNNGCKDSMSSIVNVYAKPIPAFTTPSPQCFSNNNFTFSNNSVGASAYLWHFGDGNTSTNQVPTHSYAIAGNYTTKLIVTNSYGCADSTSDVTNVLVVPTPSFITPLAQCILNNNFSFTNTSNGGTAYLWNFGDGTTSTLQNPTHNYTAANSYAVKLIVTNSNGCWDTVSNVVLVNPAATLLTGNNASICKGSSAALSIQGAQSYQWTPSVGLNCDTCTNPIATPDSTTTYTVAALTNGGCPGASTVTVTVFQPIDINVSPNKQACGTEPFTLSANGASTYLWSPAQGLSSTTSANPIATATATTQYMVVGFDNHNCFKDTGYVRITVNPKPTIRLGADQTVSIGTVMPLAASTTNGPIVSWLWTPSTDLSCSNCPRPLATIKKDITYTATVKNIYGCVATDDIHFHTICEGTQVYVPNAFTPDGDGKNDILMVRSKGIETIRSFKIYSRWGELIFEKNNFPPNNPTYGWDGKIKGVMGSAEVYVYVAQVSCDNVKDFIIKGNISILK
jgi:large repetitive protein